MRVNHHRKAEVVANILLCHKPERTIVFTTTKGRPQQYQYEQMFGIFGAVFWYLLTSCGWIYFVAFLLLGVQKNLQRALLEDLISCVMVYFVWSCAWLW